LVKRSIRNAGIGVGVISDFTKMSEKTPGSIYNIIGFTDKFKNISNKVARKNSKIT